MLYGLALPTGGPCADPRFLGELGALAEDTGWDGIFLEDYVLYQGDPKAPTCNTWVALAALAMRTERVRLGTCVTPLPRRRPWNVAREAAAVDQLSDGRFILGVGLGDTGSSVLADASLTLFGEERDEKRRAEMLDEGLEIVTGLWSGEPFAFSGKHYSFGEVTFLPKPVQQPRPPIWVGGGYPNRGPTERAARWDGSCLYRRGTHWLSPDDVRQIRANAGDRPYTIAVGGSTRRDDWDEERAFIASMRDAGADWWAEFVEAAEPDVMREQVKRGPLRVA